MAQPIYLSREGLEKLRAELEHLRTVRRQHVAESIQQSRERGGTVSNAEYEDAKNEMAFTEGRILTLDNLINHAEIIEENRGPRDIVEVGATVTVQNQEGQTNQYTIMGTCNIKRITITRPPADETRWRSIAWRRGLGGRGVDVICQPIAIGVDIAGIRTQKEYFITI